MAAIERRELTSTSVAETIAAGDELGRQLRAGQVVALVGDLGAGKTHFVKGIAESQGVSREEVSSPTFTIAHEYRGPKATVYHIDCYRLEDAAELARTGADEYIGGDGVCLIEWPQRIESLLPVDTILVSIRHAEEGVRRIQILPPEPADSDSA